VGRMLLRGRGEVEWSAAVAAAVCLYGRGVFYLSLLRCINAFRRFGIRVGSVLACVVRSSVCEGRR
jgi:hypothetical protein